jgi:wee1-like protein kinase
MYDLLLDRRTNLLGGLCEDELKEFLRQCSAGLFYIHKQDLAHLDIKPANIFRSFCETVAVEPNFEDDCNNRTSVCYKIGDLGHVSPTTAKSWNDGDCRYMSRELIEPRGQARDIRKADIFALGLSAYEAASLVDLPQNGPYWHSIRSDGVQIVEKLSEELSDLISTMIQENSATRPTANEISESEILSDYMSNQKLQNLLKAEMEKNKRLQR